MSLLTIPVVADTIARFMGSFQPKPAKGTLGFPEIAGHTNEIAVPTRHGSIACTHYSPGADENKKAGVYINLHGGGFVVPGRRQDDPWCRYLAHHAKVHVLNVEYTTAPHARFPIAVEETYDVALWATQNDDGWDRTRVAIGGQSAGGNLAAAATRLALLNSTPRLELQVLHYAPLDLVTDVRDKPSPLKKTVLKPWMSDVFDTAYIPDPTQRQHLLASPAWKDNADDLSGIAPAVVATCQNDRLRPEGVQYAKKLAQAGALLSHIDIADTDHGYNLLTTREAAERGYKALVPPIRDALT